MDSTKATRRKDGVMKNRVCIFVFCQSLGWDLMERLPFLDGLAAIRAPMRPILGSSCATLPTVLTGTLPATHKHFAWFYYSPVSTTFRMCKFFSYVPVLNRSRRVRDNLVHAVRKSFGITGRLSIFNMPLRYLPLFDFVEKRNLFEPGALGEVRTLIDFFKDANISYFCSAPEHSDMENADAISEALRDGGVSAAFWHLAGTDQILARRGTGSSASRGRVAWIDYKIRNIYEIACRNYRQVNLVVFSDSGVVPVYDVYDLKSRLEQTRFSHLQDYVAIIEPTMARFWLLTPMCRAAMARILSMLACGTVLSKEELQKEGCWFDDARFGEIIFLANPGTVFTPNCMNWDLPVAARGYHPDTPGMAAGIVSNIAGLAPPASVAEVYAMLVRLAAGAAHSAEMPLAAVGQKSDANWYG